MGSSNGGAVFPLIMAEGRDEAATPSAARLGMGVCLTDIILQCAHLRQPTYLRWGYSSFFGTGLQ